MVLTFFKVKYKYVTKSNCSTGVRKTNAIYTVMFPTSRVTFVLNRISPGDKGVYSIRLGGTRRTMENKTSLVVTGNL
jgi:hypothetical protein